MEENSIPCPPDFLEDDQLIEPVEFDFGLNRRVFVQLLGAGVLITTAARPALAQRSGRGGGRPVKLSARIHVGADGIIKVMTGKVEVGQGARAELTQGAAEELRVPVSQVQLLMADTSLVPDDGNTAGSRSTPATLPAVRQAAAAARNLLVTVTAQRWNVERDTLEVRDGKVTHPSTRRTLSYAELAQSDEMAKLFDQPAPSDSGVTPLEDWKILGTSVPRPNGRDLVTGSHRFSSDVKRPGMLRGKILRAPSYGAKLISIDLAPARAMKDVIAVQDGPFAGVAAPTTTLAEKALEAIAKTAKWESAPHPSSGELFDYLREQVEGGVPKNPFAEDVAAAHKALRATYHAAYVQHAPMETRSAVAEWNDGKLTVWTGTQNPFGYLGELTRAFRLSADKVRVIVPDTGGGFGGKHSGEAAIEAARLAQAANRPVSLKWTREEEFTWAYFRPAALIEAEATLDAKGALTSWHFVNVNSGQSAINTPYRAGKARSQSASPRAPLRHGSYRALASTANNFARECFMDELAAAAGADPLDFRLAHLENARLRAVLKEAAKRFNWRERSKQKQPDVGVGLACGTEKGSYVAACAEIAFGRKQNRINVRHVCEVFECGAIINPQNLLAQVEGCIIMGLGPALWEAMRFARGKIQNDNFGQYRVPRFSDVPEFDIHLLNRPDLPSVGAGETPIIAVAPAIGNAFFAATGIRLRAMPLVPPAVKA
ncbi:MAG: isoquinoline 1-oxidoreductase [Verrucomicrobia bacterium]|nr:isoquinoline 1-oxidoreductase [Verrucomicrobiota bacterium]